MTRKTIREANEKPEEDFEFDRNTLVEIENEIEMDKAEKQETLERIEKKFAENFGKLQKEKSEIFIVDSGKKSTTEKEYEKHLRSAVKKLMKNEQNVQLGKGKQTPLSELEKAALDWQVKETELLDERDEEINKLQRV